MRTSTVFAVVGSGARMGDSTIRYVALQNSTPEIEAQTLADAYRYILKHIGDEEAVPTSEPKNETEDHA